MDETEEKSEQNHKWINDAHYATTKHQSPTAASSQTTRLEPAPIRTTPSVLTWQIERLFEGLDKDVDWTEKQNDGNEKELDERKGQRSTFTRFLLKLHPSAPENVPL